MSSGWGGRGSTRRWRDRVRPAVLTRDQGLCQLRLDGCLITADQVHHPLGYAAGDDPDQLVAACRRCNRKIGDPTRWNPAPRPRTQW